MSSQVASVILAAGQGTRMKSDLPKVLHELAGEPMVFYPIRLAQRLGADPVVVVVGHRGGDVRSIVTKRHASGVEFREQKEQKGTGHAVMEGMKALDRFEGRVLILYGDVPLLRTESVRAMFRTMDERKLAVSLITTHLANPSGYGRIIRDASGNVVRIVEQKDATDEEKKVTEINAGIYCVEADFLRRALERLRNDNAQGEYYLTDIVSIAIADGLTARAVVVEDPDEVRGANTRAELLTLGRILRARISEAHMANGVTIADPETTYIGDAVRIGRDTVIEPGVHLRGDTVIGKDCYVDAGSILIDAELADGVTIKPYSVLEEASVKTGAQIGPFARLRPGAEIMDDARVGNFVEVKKARLDKGAKANHLAYLGDAKIGAGVNVGAGTITCNYDGHGKYVTEIGEGTFVGSNSTLVAPLTIGAGAYVAAGSTITESVGDEDLAFGRARQTLKTGRASALREAAAERAKQAKGNGK